MTSSLEHTILWRRLDFPGHDSCSLWKSDHGWQVSGTAIFLFNQMPCCLSYEVSACANWQTSAASVSGYVGQSVVALTIASTSTRLWNINGSETQNPAGCIDLDLGFTPATNLIAIRRLSLEIGERAQAPAAWLDFPDLKLKTLDQQYYRISDHEYEYASPAANYVDILKVDRYGAVTHYPRLWEQEE